MLSNATGREECVRVQAAGLVADGDAVIAALSGMTGIDVELIRNRTRPPAIDHTDNQQ